jgi:O-antigen ligase
MIYLVVAFPYWQTQSADFSSSFLARADSGNDAAVASRWSLLPVLLKEIVREPFFGQGFGSTVTYHSQDPRVLQSNPGGSYTTYAFEWGYLSLWLKLGLLGLGAYLLFLWQLTADSWKIGCRTKNYIFLALPAGIIFLAVTNAFTPYLNHPLGIGFLVLSSCLIWPDKVY